MSTRSYDVCWSGVRQHGCMDHDDVRQWVARYETAWRSPSTEMVCELFTDKATYLASPWKDPIVGLGDIAKFWEAERDGPEEQFHMASQIVAVEGDTAVVRVQVDYESASASRWRDLWVLRLEDGLCSVFEEWPFAPGQRDGH